MQNTIYKQRGQIGLFDKEATSTKLSKLGKPALQYVSLRADCEIKSFADKKGDRMTIYVIRLLTDI